MAKPESAFVGKVAVVTGGAGGIGYSTTRLLIERGARVAVADIALDRAIAVAEMFGDQAVAVPLDLGDRSSIESAVAKAVDHFGRLDVLVNNAAYLHPEVAERDLDIERADPDLWDKTFAVNVRGTMLACRAALPHIVAAGGGAVVNTVSGLGTRGHIIQTAYAASKAALIQLTRSIAASHGRRGVRCNSVAPGMTMTDTVRAAFPLRLRQLTEQETLMNRLGEPEDIAEAIVFLASDAARNITGQCLLSDGGYTSHIPACLEFAGTSP
jgi:NAD(P)-dependent dehydrogenase (short-subunit alcohol dehydrogenase family)